METTMCVGPKITKRRYTRRNSQRTMENPSATIGEIEPVVHKPTLVTEMSQLTSTLVMTESSTELLNNINCVPKKITERRYTRRNSCKTTENSFNVNASIPVINKLEPVAEMLQSNGTLVALNSPLPVANDANYVPQKITKRRYTRRKTVDISSPNIDVSTRTTNLATQPNYALVAATSPQSQPTQPVVNATNCAPKKITKRRYVRRNSFPMMDGPTFITNSVPVMAHPNYALELAKPPSENKFLQPKPPAENESNCISKKITKRRYTRRNTYKTVDNPFIISDITKPVVTTPKTVTEMVPSHCKVMMGSPSEPVMLQSKPTVVNDTNCIPKKITKRRYTRRNSYRSTENYCTKFDATGVLTSSPLIVTPQPEPVQPVQINHPPDIEEQQTEHENELWYHKKAYSFLKSLKQDYKRFKYLFNYLLREEQEKERRNIQELDKLKRIYNRMQVEETEIKRKRWCRYCELGASYLTSVGIQFYCSKECERKQNNLLSAVKDSLKEHRE